MLRIQSTQVRNLGSNLPKSKSDCFSPQARIKRTTRRIRLWTLRKGQDSARSTRINVKNAKDLSVRPYRNTKMRSNFFGVESCKNFLWTGIRSVMIERRSKSGSRKTNKEGIRKSLIKRQINHWKSSVFLKRLQSNKQITRQRSKRVSRTLVVPTKWMRALRKNWISSPKD